MIIENTNIKTHTLHHQRPIDDHQRVAQRDDSPESHRSRRSEHSYKDRFQFSDAAKLLRTQMRKLDLDKQPDAEHGLNIQIITSMFKKITGQDLQLFAPQALQDIADDATLQEPVDAPEQPSNNDSGLVYQQSLAYFESQTTTFSAEGTINTKDGERLSFSVSLSMSRSFFAGINLAQSQSNDSNKEAMTMNFSGTAAELTTTHFQFSFDSKGSEDQVEAVPRTSDLSARDSNSAEMASAAELVSTSVNSEDESVDGNDAPGKRLTASVNSIYRQLRIWQHHNDGSAQLLALGTKSIGALYLGHLTSSLPPLENKDYLGGSEHANSLPISNPSGVEQQINFTA